MNAPSEDIKDLLTYESSAGSSTELIFPDNIFIGKEPAMPNNSVTIYDTPGYPPQLGLNDKGYEFPSIQIRVRDSSYVNGWDRAEIIKDSLHGRAQVTVNGTLYSVISCTSGPFFLDWDSKNRVRFVLNFNIQRRR